MKKSENRLDRIAKLIPKDAKNSVLDIGCGDKYLSKFVKRNGYVGADKRDDADIKIDLLKDSKIPVGNKKFDLVILSQILEHLVFYEPLVELSKKASKKYILVGLPNEFTFDLRIKIFLFGSHWKDPLNKFGHKYMFNIKLIDEFIKNNFLDEFSIDKKYGVYACWGARFMPWTLKDFLARTFPTLFAKEVYYLLRKKN